jgi:prevent-host-death family protein
MQVNILEAKNRLSQLIKCAQAGEEVVIANRGKPVVQLAPIQSDGRANPSRRGNGQAILQWLEDHPLPDYARRSAAQIDAYIARERASWD